MNRDLVDILRFRRALRQAESQSHLITCSLCLRVLRGSEWDEAERVIRELRSYELDTPPRLDSGVCEACAEAIFNRRAHEGEHIAA
jgi:hypothetical protein